MTLRERATKKAERVCPIEGCTEPGRGKMIAETQGRRHQVEVAPFPEER